MTRCHQYLIGMLLLLVGGIIGLAMVMLWLTYAWSPDGMPRHYADGSLLTIIVCCCLIGAGIMLVVDGPGK